MNRNRKTVSQNNSSVSGKHTNRDGPNVTSGSYPNDVYRAMPIRSQSFQTTPNTFNFNTMSVIKPPDDTPQVRLLDPALAKAGPTIHISPINYTNQTTSTPCIDHYQHIMTNYHQQVVNPPQQVVNPPQQVAAMPYEQAVNTNQQAVNTNQQVVNTNQQVAAMPYEQAVNTNQQAVNTNQQAVNTNQQAVNTNQQVAAMPYEQAVNTNQQVAMAYEQAVNTNQQVAMAYEQAVNTNQQVAAMPSEQVVMPSEQMLISHYKQVRSRSKKSNEYSSDTDYHHSELLEEKRKTRSLTHYHISGGKGWQRIYGYVRGTDMQPIQMIKGGVIYGISISYSGIGSISQCSIFLCKNMDRDVNLDVPDENTESVIGVIKLKEEATLTKSINFTLMPDEDNKYALWKSQTVQVNRNDCLSLYAENLSGVNLEFYIEYF